MHDVNVIVTGRLLDGTDFETAVTNMAALTKLDRERIERLLRSGQPTVVKKKVSAAVGEQYRVALGRIGVEVELQTVASQPEPSELQLESKPGQSTSGDQAPLPLPPETQAARPQEGPITPPPILTTQERRHDRQAGAASFQENRQKPQGDSQGREGDSASVPASHGWTWIKQAVDLFMEERLCWTGMVVIMGVLAILVSLIPVVGSFVTTILGPVFAGGLMLAAAAQKRGAAIQVPDLFAGFSQRRNPLIMLGLFHLLFAFLLGILMVIFMALFFTGFSMINDANFMQQHIFGIMLLVLFLGMLTIPAAMGFWFAPSLIALGDLPAWPSIKASFTASLKNWSALLVYGLIVLLASLVVGLLVGLVAGLLGALLPGGGSKFIIPVIALVLASPSIAVFTLTGYTSYRDIFRPDAAKTK